MSDLVDADEVRRFCALLHERAATALTGVDDPTAVIQLCRMLPDEVRMLSQGFRVGDAAHMAEAAIDYASAGFNVYVEGRTVRPGDHRRGTAAETRGVFALVVERDGDTGKAGLPLPGEPSAVVETSPGNSHEWLFLKHAVTAAEGKRVGDALRVATAADSGTGVVTQPFRMPGTPNHPNAKKRARGRVTVPTRIERITDKVWAHTELLATFPTAPSAPPVQPPAARTDKRKKTSTRVATKAARKATPKMDRSAHFQATVAAAVSSGMTPDELEAQLREHPEGCASKYLEGTDRLRAEIDRSWAKVEAHAKPAPSAPPVIPDPDADGVALLDQVHAFLGRFVAYPSEETHIAHALWVVHTHLMDCWETTPRIAFLSPEPESGKTRALEISALLVAQPVMAINVSPAYIFRKVAADAPTILFDEADTVFGQKTGNSTSAEEVRGLLNAGHRRGAVAGRCIVRGQTVETEELPAYSAVALAGIGNLPDTILSRSILVPMRRRAPSERVQPYRPRLHDAEGHALRDRLAAWAAGAAPRITWPALPDAVQDRQADIFEPLIAVAEAAGGRWPSAARATAVTLAARSRDDAQELSLGVRLLGDMRTVFDKDDAKFTDTLIKALIALPEAPWGDLRGKGSREGKPITDLGLARRLRHYRIKPKLLRIGIVVGRGYLRADFQDAWERYLPPPAPPPEPVTPVTPVTKKGHT